MCVHRVGGLVVTASAGRSQDCDVTASYGWARALLGSYANCRVLLGSSPDVGSRDIAGPTCTVEREVFKPKKVENRLHVDKKGAKEPRGPGGLEGILSRWNQDTSGREARRGSVVAEGAKSDGEAAAGEKNE